MNESVQLINVRRRRQSRDGSRCCTSVTCHCSSVEGLDQRISSQDPLLYNQSKLSKEVPTTKYVDESDYGPVIFTVPLDSLSNLGPSGGQKSWFKPDTGHVAVPKWELMLHSVYRQGGYWTCANTGLQWISGGEVLNAEVITGSLKCILNGSWIEIVNYNPEKSIRRVYKDGALQRNRWLICCMAQLDKLLDPSAGFSHGGKIRIKLCLQVQS